MSNAKRSANGARKVVRAQQFQLEDAKGNVRGVMFADDGGTASITLKDSKNRDRIHLSVREDGMPQFGLLRENGAVALGTGICPYLGSGLAIYDSKGREILVLQVSPSGELHFPCKCVEGAGNRRGGGRSHRRRRPKTLAGRVQ